MDSFQKFHLAKQIVGQLGNKIFIQLLVYLLLGAQMQVSIAAPWTGCFVQIFLQIF